MYQYEDPDAKRLKKASSGFRKIIRIHNTGFTLASKHRKIIDRRTVDFPVDFMLGLALTLFGRFYCFSIVYLDYRNVFETFSQYVATEPFSVLKRCLF